MLNDKRKKFSIVLPTCIDCGEFKCSRPKKQISRKRKQPAKKPEGVAKRSKRAQETTDPVTLGT